MRILFLLSLAVGLTASESSLVLIRHGEGEHNVQHIWSETAPLTEMGQMQALKRGEDLLTQGFSSENIAVVYVSPRLRTRQTARMLVEAGLFSDEQIIYDERLREVNVGALEGKPMVPWGDEDLWDLPFASVMGGETIQQVQERMGNFLSEVLLKEYRGHVFVISHGAPLRELLGLLGQSRIKMGTAEAKVLKLQSN